MPLDESRTPVICQPLVLGADIVVYSATKAVALRNFQNDLFGGMLSIELAGGEKAVYSLFRNLKTIKFAPSLGGVSTTTSYPAKTSRRSFTDEELEKANISKGLVRISVGLENIDDIISEFQEAISNINTA